MGVYLVIYSNSEYLVHSTELPQRRARGDQVTRSVGKTLKLECFSSMKALPSSEPQLLQILKFFAVTIGRHVALTSAVNFQCDMGFCYGSVCDQTFR